jgi:hypothetical protein
VSGSNLFIALSLLFFTQNNWSDKYVKHTLKRLEGYFGIQAELSDPVQWDAHALYFTVTESEITVGHAVLAQAWGKYDYFDFLVFYDRDARVKFVEVLDYREEYGFEISSKRWLKQFIGLGGSDEILFHQDVQGISGATLSSRSITNRIDELTKKLREQK